MAKQYGVSGESYQTIAASFLRRDYSIDSDATEDGNIIELPAPDAGPEQQLEAKDWQSFTAMQLQQAMDTLSERDRYIIRHRYLIEPSQTLKDLSEELGISIERVRQLEARALKKIGALCSDFATQSDAVATPYAH